MAKEIKLSEEQIASFSKMVAEEVLSIANSDNNDENSIEEMKKQIEKLTKEKDELANLVKSVKPKQEKGKDEDEAKDPQRLKMRQSLKSVLRK